MTAKEYLRQIRRIDVHIDHLLKEREELERAQTYLRNLAISEDVNWSVESSNFYKRLKTVQERARNEALIPEKIKDMLRLEEK